MPNRQETGAKIEQVVSILRELHRDTGIDFFRQQARVMSYWILTLADEKHIELGLKTYFDPNGAE